MVSEVDASAAPPVSSTSTKHTPTATSSVRSWEFDDVAMLMFELQGG